MEIKLLLIMVIAALLVTIAGEYNWAFIAWSMVFLSFVVFYMDGMNTGNTIRISHPKRQYKDIAPDCFGLIEYAKKVGEQRRGGYLLIEELYVHAKRIGLGIGKVEIDDLLVFYSSIGKINYVDGILLFGDSPRYGISCWEGLKGTAGDYGIEKRCGPGGLLSTCATVRSADSHQRQVLINEHEMRGFGSAISLPYTENIRLLNLFLSGEVVLYERD